MSYENILTLKARHIRLDLIQTYKILHGVDNVDYDDKYLTMNKNSTRNNGYKLL